MIRGRAVGYLEWFHHAHIPEKLSRPGYLWAAHYELGHGGPRFQKVVDGLVHADAPDLGRGRGFLALFGGLSAHTFLNPSPGQLKERQDALTQRMLGVRQESYSCIFSQETRVDGPDVARRAGHHAGPSPDGQVQRGEIQIENVGEW